MRFLKLFSFYSWFSRFLRKNSLSLLDWWDFETQISFSSRFSRFWEKFLFLFSIYEIFWKQFSFSSQFSRFLETNRGRGRGGAIYTSKGADNANRAIKSYLQCYLVAKIVTNAIRWFLFWWTLILFFCMFWSVSYCFCMFWSVSYCFPGFRTILFFALRLSLPMLVKFSQFTM